MERLRGEAATERAGLVSRSRRVPAPPERAALSAAARPRSVWTAPGEPTVVGSGAAAVLTAAGPDRFEAVREAAAGLFADADVGGGAVAARPRLFGGFAFHDEHEAAPPWSGFPGAAFVLPRAQLTYGDDAAWLTVSDVGPDADEAAVERRLAATADRRGAADGPPASDALGLAGSAANGDGRGGDARDGGAGDARDDGPATFGRPGRSPVGAPPGVAARELTTPRSAWRDSVTAAVERIRAGELQKVVLAQALRVDLERPLSTPDALARLAETYPDCHRFLFDAPAEVGGSSDAGGSRPAGGCFFGATPERLVSLRGRTVETGALAGTTGRGETPAEDEWLASELLADPKNGHEHDLVVEALRDQLAPLAASVTTGRRTIRRLATVQHIETPVTAELATDEHVLTLVEALHPTPAVGGLPPDRALATIRETEPFERGWYAAPVGWFDAAGNGSFAVAIRAAVAHGGDGADAAGGEAGGDGPAAGTGVGPDRATLFAGVGLVADSDPDREWDEVQLKYRPILDALE